MQPTHPRASGARRLYMPTSITPMHHTQHTAHDTERHTTHIHALQDAEHGEVGEDAWRAALLRARGEKVLDDPRLLRRSAKREAKNKAKRKQAWQQRVKQQADEQASRQQRCV